MRRHLIHLATAVVVAMLAVLAAGTAEETPEQRARREQQEAQRREEMNQYFARMESVRAEIDQRMATGPAPSACDVPTMLTRAQNHEYNRVHVHLMYAPFLRRFGTADRAVWADLGGPWQWMTDTAYRSHFEQHPDDRLSYAREDTARRIQETFLADRYLAIVAPAANEPNAMPTWQNDTTYLPGYFAGWVFIADQVDGTIACQFPISARSSDEVSFSDRGAIRTTREEATQDDFEDNFERAMNASLPSGMSLDTPLGGIL